ncbi:MAG: CoA transferase [Syntrophales bacterium]|nr:CoA transferase [Syntrophales bacterium]MDY0043242.1 CoA transferase [Syntrophales bacterium]
METMKSVLEKIRVLDLSRHISGPFGGLLLADFGAEVIRIERPGGEDDRYMGLQGPSGEGFMFLNQARNKKAITLDFMKKGKGFAILLELVKKSDVLLHNFSPGAVRKLGIGYEELKNINPALVYAEITGFGSRGPYADRLGFDQIAQAMSGAMNLTGFPEMPPQRAEVRYCDFSAGTFAALGILMALYHRKSTGAGQKVETNLFATGVAMNALAISEYEKTGRKRSRMGNRSWYTGPSDLYLAKDGRWVYISMVTKGLFQRFCTHIGRDDLIGRQDLQSDYDRFIHRDEIDCLVKEFVSRRTADDAIAELHAARLPCGVVNDVDEVAEDPQVLHDRSLMDITYDKWGTLKLCGVPIGLSETPGEIKRPPPRVGEHNREIYCGLLEMREDELAALEAEGVI